MWSWKKYKSMSSLAAFLKWDEKANPFHLRLIFALWEGKHLFAFCRKYNQYPKAAWACFCSYTELATVELQYAMSLDITKWPWLRLEMLNFSLLKCVPTVDYLWGFTDCQRVAWLCLWDLTNVSVYHLFWANCCVLKVRKMHVTLAANQCL